MKASQTGFSVVELLIGIIVVGLIGAAGWYVWQSNGKKPATTNTSQTTQTQQETSKEAANDPDPYEGWKTYTSKIGSGLTFKYPADWYYPDGGHTLYSVKPTFSKPIPAGGVSTNQYLCVTVDEYAGSGLNQSNWQTSKPVKDVPLTINGKTVNFGLFAGSSPMMSELYINNPSHPSGDHFITTKEGYVVSIKAAYNYCQQSGGEDGITNPQADFLQQPEVKTAELIIQSIKF